MRVRGVSGGPDVELELTAEHPQSGETARRFAVEDVCRKAWHPGLMNLDEIPQDQGGVSLQIYERTSRVQRVVVARDLLQ